MPRLRRARSGRTSNWLSFSQSQEFNNQISHLSLDQCLNWLSVLNRRQRRLQPFVFLWSDDKLIHQRQKLPQVLCLLRHLARTDTTLPVLNGSWRNLEGLCHLFLRQTESLSRCGQIEILDFI